jgi:4-hydroxy-2-oxovalerate aldolase
MISVDEAPDILEATLRDGSYVVDFQFTAADTATIASALESVGFRWIEVGHGLGLGASRAGQGRAAASDEEYLEAAAASLNSARWGMFFIAGLGTLDDLRLASRYNMSFVRIGANITEAAAAEPYIRLAKELGMIVSFNAMKSYAVSPETFGDVASTVAGWGSDIVCLVDSAGGMYPEDIAAYVAAARERSEVKLGFHGHDNFSLAVVNSIRAIEAGAVLVDGCLQGLGRSPGNAASEILVAVFKQRGLVPHLDLKAVMDVGHGLIRPLMNKRGVDPIALTSGYARFHSSFTSKVMGYAARYGLDPRDLIIRLCEEDQVSAPDSLLERLSQELASQTRPPRVMSISAFGLPTPSASGTGAVEDLVSQLRPHAVKAGKFSTLNVVISNSPHPEIVVSGNIHSMPSHVMGTVTVYDAEQLRGTLSAADGNVDVVLLDVERKRDWAVSPARIGRTVLQKSLLLTYLDSRVWVDAVEDQVARLLGEGLDDERLVIAGDHMKSRLLALRLAERGAAVTLITDPGIDVPPGIPEWLGLLSSSPARPTVRVVGADSPDIRGALSGAHAVIVWPESSSWFAARHVGCVPADACILDAGVKGITAEGLGEARRRGCRLVRVNMWSALAGAVAAAHDSSRVVQEALGRETIGGVPVVSGGVIGEAGDVVVDNVRRPRQVIGLADGEGGVLYHYGPFEHERARQVSEEIIRQLVAPPLTADG